MSTSQRQSNGQLIARCRETWTESVEVLSTFDARSGGASVYRFTNDLHWSSLAHRVAAEEMVKRFSRDAVSRDVHNAEVFLPISNDVVGLRGKIDGS